MKKLSLFLLFSLAGTGLLAETKKRIPVEADSSSVRNGDSWDIDEVEMISRSSFRELIQEAFDNQQVYSFVKVISNGFAHYYDFVYWNQYKDSGSAYSIINNPRQLTDPQRQPVISEEVLFIAHPDCQVWKDEALARRELPLVVAWCEARKNYLDFLKST